MRERDRITLTGISATGYHGVLPAERRDGQRFVVDAVLHLDLAPAGRTDDLRATVNYAEVAADVVAVLTGEPRDLIETVAETIAGRLLLGYPVETVEVTVHKPQAPVGVPFADVAVQVVRSRDVPVVIALGANLDDPATTLQAATRRLRRTSGLHRVRLSGLYRSTPVGGPPEQPDYINAVALANTRLTPMALLRALQRIEDDHGRTRTTRWGPRTLDLDLIQYGEPGGADEFRSDTDELTLPHPRAHQRAFVLEPWHEVDPQAQLRVGTEVMPVELLLSEADSAGVQPLEQQ